MIVLILMNIIFIIYILNKFYNFPKEVYKREKKENIEEKNPMILSYIEDKKLKNNFDLVLAEIIELNIKGYVTIEYNKDDIDKYFYTIKQNVDFQSINIENYEMIILNFLFAEKPEISKNELEEKFSNTFQIYNLQYNELGKMLDKTLVYEHIVDTTKDGRLKRIIKNYMRLSIGAIFIIFILYVANKINVSILDITLYLMANITSIWLLSNASIYTVDGQILKYSIDEYKAKIENEEYLINKNSMIEIVKNKQFANSIALHVETDAKKALIDNRIIKEAVKKSKKVGLMIFLGLNIAFFALIILTIAVPKEIVAWIYLLLVIAIACSADIAFSYSKKK